MRTARLVSWFIAHFDEYRAENLRNWESRVPVHAASRDYDLTGLAADRTRLSPVVEYDRPWLGDLTGLDSVHVQCHLGTDTISLARLGARVTGADFDLVYTGVGALNWLPDIAGWGRVVAGLLRPGGRLYVRDGHPMMYTLLDGIDDDVLRGEIVQAVIDAGLTVTALREHRECEWKALTHLVEGPDGKFRLAEGVDRLPLMFTLEARR